MLVGLVPNGRRPQLIGILNLGRKSRDRIPEAIDLECAVGKPEFDFCRIERVDHGGCRHGTTGSTDGADIVLVAPNAFVHRQLRAVTEQLVLRPLSHADRSMCPIPANDSIEIHLRHPVSVVDEIGSHQRRTSYRHVETRWHGRSGSADCRR